MKLFYKLFNLSCFTYTISQVVQFRTAYFTMTDNLNLNYMWGMKRPCFLNTNTVGALSYCESLSCASTLSLKYCTLEDLNTLTCSLFDQCVYSYCVSYAELRYFGFQLSGLNVLNNFVLFFLSLIILDVLNTHMVTEDHLFSQHM